jgi:hypothetical protein
MFFAFAFAFHSLAMLHILRMHPQAAIRGCAKFSSHTFQLTLSDAFQFVHLFSRGAASALHVNLANLVHPIANISR